MKTIVANNANEYYVGLLNLLKTQGKHVVTRGKNMIEVTGVTAVLTNPRRRINTLPSRKWPKKGFVMEFLWYMSGNSSVDTIEKYLKAWRQFAREDGTVNSNYGVYMLRGVPRCIEILREDSGARHACFNIYDTKHSAEVGSKDVPCTFAIQFLIRSGKLDMIVFNRSRDCIRGEAGGDMFAFTLLQELVANELSVEVGSYTSMMGSLHIYEQDWYRLFILEDDQRLTFSMKDAHSPRTSMKFTTFWQDLEDNLSVPWSNHIYTSPDSFRIYLMEAFKNNNFDGQDREVRQAAAEFQSDYKKAVFTDRS